MFGRVHRTACINGVRGSLDFFRDSAAKANAYVKSSRLKAPKKETFSAVRPFRKSSLLCYYSYAEVEEYYTPDPPVDPSL